MHSHITLVGGQVIPVYLGILETNPDKVIFIHSKETLHQAKKIESLLKSESVFIEVDPVNFEDIFKKCSSYFSDDKKQFISVNVSSGTKIMSIALFLLSVELTNSECFYIDQNNQIFDLKKRSKANLKLTIDTEMFFKLADNPIKSFRNIKDISEDEFEIVKDVREMIEFNPGEYFSLINMAQKHQNEVVFRTKKGSVLIYDSLKKTINLELINHHGQSKKKTFKKNNIYNIIINTTWFELEIVQLIKKWKFARDILLHAIVPYQTGSDKNEIDIVVNTGSKLLFIECKLQVNDIKDIDKFRNVVKNYGGLGAKSILITDQIIRPNVVEKCKDNNILYFTLKDAKKSVFFSPEKLLFMMLESELFSINPL